MLVPGVIPKRLHLGFTIKVIITVAAGLAVTAALLHLTGQVWLGTTYAEGLRVLSGARRLILRNSVIIYLITLLLVAGGTVLLSLLYSHKIAGPLYRLGVTARRVTDGDLTVSVKLRDGDAVHPLAESMNLLVESYGGRARELLEGLESLKRATAEVQRAAEGGSQEELRKAVDKLSERAGRLRKGISDIRL